jgi:hypothetical protein
MADAPNAPKNSELTAYYVRLETELGQLLKQQDALAKRTAVVQDAMTAVKDFAPAPAAKASPTALPSREDIAAAKQTSAAAAPAATPAPQSTK